MIHKSFSGHSHQPWRRWDVGEGVEGEMRTSAPIGRRAQRACLFVRICPCPAAFLIGMKAALCGTSVLLACAPPTQNYLQTTYANTSTLRCTAHAYENGMRYGDYTLSDH